MENISPNKEYEFIKILATKADTRRAMHVEFLELMSSVFGKSFFSKVFLQTAEIENCSAKFKTVYDINRPQKRAVNILNNVFGEIEQCILKCWESSKAKLVEQGVI